jgi:hypothetical protein
VPGKLFDGGQVTKWLHVTDQFLLRHRRWKAYSRARASPGRAFVPNPANPRTERRGESPGCNLFGDGQAGDP